MIRLSSGVAGAPLGRVWKKSLAWAIAIAALLACLACAGTARKSDVGSCGIQMAAVQSSMISAVGYDAQNKTLRIHFIQNADYDYSGVPSEIYQNLLSAESKGKYYHQYIKGQFPSKRVR